MNRPSSSSRAPGTSAGPSCLAGGGEMGALMRAFDWSRTPVGRPEEWPQSLRTVVSTILPSKFGMYVAWGREFTQFYNDGYRPILGSTKHPAIGKSARDTFGESWHIIGPLFDQVMEGGSVGSDDWMLPLDRHGYLEECHFIFSYSPLLEEGEKSGGVLVTVAESTARVLGERRLRTLMDLAARASESRSPADAWRGALEALSRSGADVPFAILYEIDPGGRTASLVGTTAGLEGDRIAPRSVELGPESSEGWPLGPAARRAEPTVVSDLRRRFAPLPSGEWTEAPHTAVILPITRPGLAHPYGLLVAGVSAGRALDDRYREFHGLVANHIVSAVGNARSYEEERRRAESLAELDRAKTVFFSNISHEFRTPLTLMLGPIADLRSGAHGTLTPPQEEQAEILQRNAHRLLKLVNSLLDFARIEAGRIEAFYEPVDLSLLTADLAGVFRSAIERAGLRLRVECPPLAEPVYVDRDMWEKVVLNLLSNALKFTFEGEIAVSLRDVGDDVELEVRDTGAGIAAEEQPNLFRRFHRVMGARARSQEGSGIGLALVQELARLHGGGVSVESEPGRGSAFRVRVRKGRAHLPPNRVRVPGGLDPAAPAAAAIVRDPAGWVPADGDAGGAHAGPAAGATAGGSGGRILVADDNADMRAYLRRLLGEGWTVESVADGNEALKAARRDPPDLVIADVMMPGLDGFALLKALRADERTAHVSVMMLSARAGEEARVEGLDAGADDYLIKPFSARELTARVITQIGLARARGELERQRGNLYALFTQAPAPICVIRGEGLVFEMANSRYEEVVGRRVVGRTLLEAMPELAGQGFDDLPCATPPAAPTASWSSPTR